MKKLNLYATVLCTLVGISSVSFSDTINPTLLVNEAQRSAEHNNPQAALVYYQKALSASGKDTTLQRVALFGIGKMYLWLGNNVEANTVYSELLKQPLSKADYNVATAGYNKSLPPAPAPVKKDNSPPPQFQQYISEAQQSALQNNPEMALHNYQMALNISGNNLTLRRIALFGIGKMQLWLGNDGQSLAAFQSILTQPLSINDYNIALAGYVDSLAFTDKPIQAFHVIPPTLTYTQPAMLLASSRAALWSGWPQTAQYIINQNYTLYANTDPNSAVYHNLQAIDWQSYNQAAKDTFIPAFTFEDDNDDNSVYDTTLLYSHRFSINSTTSIIANNYQLRDNDSKIYGNVIQLGQNWMPYQCIDYYAQAGQGNFEGWKPAIWNAGFTFTPNDALSINVDDNNQIIETVDAIQSHIAANDASVNVSVNPLYRFNIYGSINDYNFTDDNLRHTYYVAGDYLMFPSIGLTAEIIARGFNDSIPNAAAYFDPSTYKEQTIGLIWRHRVSANGSFYVNGSYGVREATGEAHSPSEGAQAGFSDQLNRYVSMNTFLGYTNSAFDVSAGGYIYRFGGLSLVIGF